MLTEWRAFVDRVGQKTPLAEPGERKHFEISVAETIDGQPVALPLIVVRGATAGPTLWVHSTVHGDEVNCIGAVHQLLQDLNPSQLAGTLLVVPVLNIAGFRGFQREAPYDHADMNRIWDRHPSTLGFTKVFSYVWVQRVLEIMRALRPSYVVDLHDGGVALRIMSHVLYAVQASEYAPDINRVGRATGMEIVWEHEGLFFGGSTTAQMHALKIPAFVLESGGIGQMVSEDVREMLVGLRNLMKAIAMLPGVPSPRADQRVMRKGHWVRNERAGIFRPAVRLGQRVAQGDLIGEMVTLFGDVWERITAPAHGVVFGLRQFAVANIGDYICNVGEVT
jgi:hypothetical protein